MEAVWIKSLSAAPRRFSASATLISVFPEKQSGGVRKRVGSGRSDPQEVGESSERDVLRGKNRMAGLGKCGKSTYPYTYRQINSGMPEERNATQPLKRCVGASLVAQWLRICLPMQGTRVRALVREDPTCRGATRPVSHNY